MTLQNGVTDDQLGRFYRKTRAISERLGKSLSFDEVMQALQQIHDGKMRVAGDMPEDLRHFFRRTINQKKTLEFLVSTGVSDVAEKEAVDLFSNKRRFNVDKHAHAYALTGKQLGQEAAAVTIFKMSGMYSSQTIAAEFLNVSDETSASWLKELLINRGHTFTLPVIEELIELETTKTAFVGLNRCKKPSDVCDYPGNVAFVETFPGMVELVHFSRVTYKGWHVWREPFDFSDHKYETNRNQDYLVIRN